MDDCHFAPAHANSYRFGLIDVDSYRYLGPAVGFSKIYSLRYVGLEKGILFVI